MQDIKDVSKNFTDKFSFKRKENSLTLTYFCECCGKKEEITKELPKKEMEREISSEESQKVKVNRNVNYYQELFLEINNELRSKFYICDYCHKLICQQCWNNKDSKCPNCKLYKEVISID
ncbi:MAG: hypothetical protein GF308_03360 [Candidatus Heimdallarchaeota archaeon]|nr:hypothetical protein [Candidatus Heimdallarchaeota archaeon]